MIEIDRVHFSYAVRKGALEDIELRISPGECILLCGESGCGKTTLTKLINGLIPHFTPGRTLSAAPEYFFDVRRAKTKTRRGRGNPLPQKGADL